MLEITIPEVELFIEGKNEFYTVQATKLTLEHSLLSVKKWEAKWHKPFLGQDKSMDEIKDYIRCMTISTNPKQVDPLLYRFMPYPQIEKVVDYIKDSMTATWFSDRDTMGAPKIQREVVTAEIIYYWMVTLQIPVEFEKWHLNQLMTLIRVINEKNKPAKKMSKKETAKYNAELNRARRAKYHTKG